MRHDIAAAAPDARPRQERTADDPTLLARRHGGAVQRHGALRHLARGRVAGHRGPGGPRGRAGRGRGDLPGQGPDGRRRVRGRRARAREGHRPRRGGLRRCGAGAHRRTGRLADPLRPDLVRRRGHRLVRHPDQGGRPVAGRPRRVRRRTQGPGPRAAGRAGDGPHARHARRAHHLRCQVRAVGTAGRPRPAAAAGGPRRHRRGQALGRRRDLLQHRSPRWRRGSAPPSA